MAGRAWALATLRRGSQSKGRSTRSRGQAMVEFALVLPLLFTVIFAFIYLSVFVIDGSMLNHAVLRGARVGNEKMVLINSQITMPSNLKILTPYPYLGSDLRSFGPYSVGAGDTCQKQRNTVAGGPGYSSRLGWDWTCGVLANLQLPLVEAAKETDRSWNGLHLGMSLDSGHPLTVTACYADEGGKCMAQIVGIDTTGTGLSFSGFNLVNGTGQLSPAPSFMRIEASVRVMSWIDIPLISSFLPAYTDLKSTAVEVLDRFLPACPAPNTGCRSIY